ncbi:MAG: hypothetical protein ACFBSF_11475 [Leptolyngbyaceae cyanobacterium]
MTQFARLYREFGQADPALAEAGVTDYATFLQPEDRAYVDDQRR